MVRSLVLLIFAALLLPTTAFGASDFGRDVYNVLPAGQDGAYPLTKHSADQLPLYDGLTPLYDQVKASDIPKYFKSERFRRDRQARAHRASPQGPQGRPRFLGRAAHLRQDP